MSKQANPTLIGAFVFGALILATIAILLLAGDQWFRERDRHIMYFEEAGQGLKVGAPVVFLGVKVGTVKHIEIGLKQENKNFLVQVTVELDLRMIRTDSGKRIKPHERFTIRQLVDQGLRARLKMQSLLTGQLYVDLGFYPEKPAHFVGSNLDGGEIPTIPTTVEELAEMLEDFPTADFLADLAAIGSSVSKIFSSPAIHAIPVRLEATLAHLEAVAARLDTQGGPLLAEAETSFAELHKAITAVQSAMVKVGKAANKVEKFADAASPAAEGIAQASTDLADAARTLQELADEDAPIVQRLSQSLQEISRAARALRLLADSLEQQPEAIFRGKQPEEDK
jgi:paraquat-inducible protein B